MVILVRYPTRRQFLDMSYAALRHPDQAAVIQRVLAIPTKRTDRQLVSFLTHDETDALLASPDRTTWLGRRDHALLLDIELGTGAYLRCHGKGRKERITPLTTQTCAVLNVWLAERQGGPSDPLFPSRRHGPLSRDAVAVLVAKHARTAASRCPSIRTKNVSPHVLRHTCAMNLLAVGIDTSVIALWLGHEGIETTQVYLHADLAIKERALARTTPPGTTPGRYRAPDALLAFLEAL